MNYAKAVFFDSETASEWSSKEYTLDELLKVERILEAAELKNGDMVVEPGCGTGRLTKLILEKVGLSGIVIASDVSPKMLEQSRIRLKGFVNVHLLHEAIEKVPLGLRTIDVTLCHNVFPHFDNKPMVLAKLVAALKTGGRFIVSHFMGSSEVNNLHRKTNPAVANDFLPDQERMMDLFNEAGMRIEYVVDDERGYLLKAMKK